MVSILQDHKWHTLLFVLITTELSPSDRLFAGNERLKTQSLVGEIAYFLKGMLWKHALPSFEPQEPCKSQVFQCTPENPAIGRLRQERQEFVGQLVYLRFTERPCLKKQRRQLIDIAFLHSHMYMQASVPLYMYINVYTHKDIHTERYTHRHTHTHRHTDNTPQTCPFTPIYTQILRQHTCTYTHTGTYEDT